MLLKLALVLLSLCAATKALKREELYPFYPSEENKLADETDDVSSPEVQLSVPIVFYGTVYKTIFINDNGIISFLTEVPGFFNSQFPLSYPIIAPMYSDVDTRGNGEVYYRETKSKDLLDRATQDIVRFFSRASQFRAQSLFIVTWADVGRYNSQPNPTNTAQVVIASNGNDSYVIFLYPENGVQWIQGDGKIANLPDARAQAGFMSGDGRYYILPGSGTDQMRNFDKMSNVYRPGMWIYNVGTDVIAPDIDGDKPLRKSERETCASSLLPCPPTASCTDYDAGFCCACIDGYFGNGRQCLANNQPLRMNGKLNGVINDVKLENVDLHAYIVTEEGRSYTAFSRIPPSIGYDMQTLSTLGNIISWLFASAKSNAPNGFTITGGIINRTAEVDFPQSGQHVSISEQFLGPDVFNFLKVNIEIRGSLPPVPYGSKIEIEDFKEEYTRVSRGLIRSHASHSYKHGENSLSIPIVVDQTIAFEECAFAPQTDKSFTNAYVLSVARNYIVYDNREQIVRYASTSKISPSLVAEDPCTEGRSKCGSHSSCVVKDDSFRCACDRGYELSVEEDEEDNDNSLAECVDIDECSTARDHCHTYADCANTDGSHTCTCKRGYTGNGINCQKDVVCDDLRCDKNGDCVHLTGRNPECKCRVGFAGDGYVCRKGGSETEDCRSYNLCDINAECIGNPMTERFQCFCRQGYKGDGIVCVEESQSCELLDNCGSNAECISDDIANSYYCACNPGFVGDGYTCIPEVNQQSCYTLNNCHPNGQCLYESVNGQYQCRCNEGFSGDGFQCTRTGEVSCSEDSDICSPNADCVYDQLTRRNACKCRDKFRGDGITCKPVDDCGPQDNSCDRNARCLYNSVESRYQCQCNNGYSGDGRRCIPDEDAACNFVNNCNANASCIFDVQTLKYKCHCNIGFKGDGKQCKPQKILSCNIINHCDFNAECAYSFDAQAYRCQCLNGFIGDGYVCRPLKTCREDLSLCDRNAECLYIDALQSFTCQCRQGFIGDGSQNNCAAAPRHEGDYLIFTQGMSLLRTPLKPTPEDSGRLLLTKPHQIPAGLDVDCLYGHVYWSDVAFGSIYRALYNGSSIETIIEGVLRSPEGVAIDWVSRNIYWTDSLKDTIEVSLLDGRLRKTLISIDLSDPRGIAVHPGIGKMYWSDWNRAAPKIEVANMDGSGRSVLVSNDLGLPNNLAIDFDRNELCWTDAGLHRIECMQLNSLSRRVVHTQTAHPYDLALIADSIYWTDWQTKHVQRVDRNGGVPEKLDLPAGGNGRLYSIAAVARHCPRISNACSAQNGGCRHLCLPNGRNGRTCACPDDDHSSCNEVY